MRVTQIPAAPVRRCLEEWASKKRDRDTDYIAARSNLTVEFVKRFRGGRSDDIDFDKADAIVTRVLGGWDCDPELYAIFQDFDLSELDKRKPCAA